MTLLPNDLEIDALIVDLGSNDNQTRVRALRWLNRAGLAAFESLAFTLLNDANPTRRSCCATALSNLDDVRVIQPLMTALKDKNKDVRRTTAIALANIHDPQSFDALVSALEDTDWIVRDYAATGLGRIGDARGAVPLLAKLQQLGNERASIVWALGHFNDARAIQPLIERLQDAQPSVRGGAAWSLGEISDPSVIPSLEQLLKDREQADFATDESVADLAKEAIQKIKKRSAKA